MMQKSLQKYKKLYFFLRYLKKILEVETQRLINLDEANCIPISHNSLTKSEVRLENDLNVAKNMDFVDNGETIDSLSLFSKTENIQSRK